MTEVPSQGGGRNGQAPSWWDRDHITLLTVGIDIGTATSHIMFTEVECRRMGDALSSRFVVTDRRILFRSHPRLTPYTPDDLISGDELSEWATDEYRTAGIDPADVDTGAVILTGEAIRRENAPTIASALAGLGGDFLITTAGHHMEAMLAAHGSGAVELSAEQRCSVLNVDMGGGTTKLALIEDGAVVETAALHVGGRLAAFDEHWRIIRLEPAGARWAEAADVGWVAGDAVSEEDIDRVVAPMVEAVVAAIEGDSDAVPGWAWLTTPLHLSGAPDVRFYSGGVAEHLLHEGPDDIRDLGSHLARGIARRLGIEGDDAVSARSMTATVIGASAFTVELSGSTIFVSDESVLPLRDVPVVSPPLELGAEVSPEEVAEVTTRHLEARGIAPGGPVAFAIDWRGEPSHARLRGLADGLALVAAACGLARSVVCFVFSGDVARNFGHLLVEESHYPGPVVSVDGIELKDFDFVDIGRPAGATGAVPLSIKSLLFSMDPEGEHTGVGAR